MIPPLVTVYTGAGGPGSGLPLAPAQNGERIRTRGQSTRILV